MSPIFNNKYRIQSARLQNWDYSRNAPYFITICAHNRFCFFGDVVDGEMVLNDIGIIANNCWLAIPEHFPFAKLGHHVVMPNHFHGIVIIDKPVDGSNDDSDKTINNRGGITGNKNPMLHNNLSNIIRWYKGRTTYDARKINTDFGWQSRFHDHIIRNDESFHRISAYIINNPKKWTADRFHDS